jgi:N-acetylglucosaminyldiphosphoundecaprenol N-acetyl-beta-D-mannosaminyltransferase
MLQKRVNLFGVMVDDVSVEQAVALASDSLDGGRLRIFFTPNLEMLAGARVSERTRDMLNFSTVSLADGVGIRIVAALLRTPLEFSGTGIDFGEALFEAAAKRGARIFLLGGKEGVAERAGERLRQRYSGLYICGTCHGYFSHADEGDVCDLINASGADILIVCRGFPRQETFVYRNAQKLPTVRVTACLGGSLDVWSGEVKRAPICIRKIHFEWLWRILNDPRRLQRFMFSLPVLCDALEAWIKNSVPHIRMKRGPLAYNQTDTSL